MLVVSNKLFPPIVVFFGVLEVVSNLPPQGVLGVVYVDFPFCEEGPALLRKATVGTSWSCMHNCRSTLTEYFELF